MARDLAVDPSVAGAKEYAQITALSEEAIRSPAAFTGLVGCAPRLVKPGSWSAWQERHEVLRSWHRTSLELLAASVLGEMPRTVAASLLDHLPDHVGWRQHRQLPLRTVGTPTFFRTDQAEDGTVLEVQCPGSLWGVHEILLEFYAEAGDEEARKAEPLSAKFTAALRKRLGAAPVVHHLMDNSSHPAGERFFIQRARRGASYYGFDAGVRPGDCNFVRGHDFLALLAENFAGERVRRLMEGQSVYDLPPVALFDQKLLLALPFWDETREYFADAVRDLFPYTTVLATGGLRLEGGEWVTIEQFSALPRRGRAYFLKYAGSDVGRNWGSRAVFHLGKLSRSACETRLRAAVERFGAGERWIVQRERPSEQNVSYITRDGEVATTAVHSKHSIFYGPYGALGMLMMFERFYKVHGSVETIATVGIPTGRGAPDQARW
jgi:hypothetical protein